MKQQYISFTDHTEEVISIGETLRNGRCERLIFQIRTIHQIIDCQQAIQINRSVDLVQIFLIELKMFQQKLGDVDGAVMQCFQTNCIAITTMRQFTLDRA